MNWNRIWIGAAAASGVLWLVDIAGILVALGMQRLAWTENVRSLLLPVAMQAIPSLIAGFLLAWLYVLARPRLGPGPRTALIIGSIAWALVMQPFFNPLTWDGSASLTAAFFALSWVKYVGATYLAGWLYIEKAP